MVIKIFADGADIGEIERLAVDAHIAGFTTNPTLLRKAGVQDYREFGKGALLAAGAKPVSLEVFADDFYGMRRQALEIASWGPNAFVKIPVVQTDGYSCARLIRALVEDGVQLNVTAVFTEEQVHAVAGALDHGTAAAVVSVFAGRIADTGVDPLVTVSVCRRILRQACPRAEMLWASPRQVYDVVLAERAGCEIITMTPDLIAKMALFGRDLSEYSRETVEMFYHDAQAAGYEL